MGNIKCANLTKIILAQLIIYRLRASLITKYRMIHILNSIQ